MPAKSKAQQAVFGIAAGVKEGKGKAKPGSASAKIAQSMNLSDIKDFASTPTKGLPQKAAAKKTSPQRPARQMNPAPPTAPAAPTPTPAASTAPPAMPGMSSDAMPMKMNKVGNMKKIPGSGM